MILYYTATQKTKVFAEALGDILKQKPYALKSPLNEKPKLKFIIYALYLAVTGKGYTVSPMPDISADDTLYLCAPIWGGQLAGPAWFFLNNADLKNKTVHLLLTCGSLSSSDKYRKKAKDTLKLIDCLPGAVYAFATTDKPPEKDVITEQLREMLPE